MSVHKWPFFHWAAGRSRFPAAVHIKYALPQTLVRPCPPKKISFMDGNELRPLFWPDNRPSFVQRLNRTKKPPRHGWFFISGSFRNRKLISVFNEIVDGRYLTIRNLCVRLNSFHNSPMITVAASLRGRAGSPDAVRQASSRCSFPLHIPNALRM